MSGYPGGWVKQMIAIQAPLKAILRRIGRREISLSDTGTLISLLEEVQKLPKLDMADVKDPNTAILISVWRDMKEQFSDSFLTAYEVILDPAVNYGLSKIDYDSLYKSLFVYFLEEILRRGYQFPGHNRPSSTLWQNIPPGTKARLLVSLKANYDLYQERCKTIDEKLPPDDPVNIQNKASRYEQYVNRVLADFEREVVAWER